MGGVRSGIEMAPKSKKSIFKFFLIFLKTSRMFKKKFIYTI